MELLNVTLPVKLVNVLLVMAEFMDEALDIMVVLLMLDNMLVELRPLEVPVLMEVVSTTELVEETEVVVVIGKSVIEDSLVVTEEVLDSEFMELVDELVVLGFFELLDELVGLDVPSIQSQSDRSWGTLNDLNGDEALVLLLV